MDNSEIRKEIQEEVRKAEKILVGIGACLLYTSRCV